jgi:CheY-like chemotaxis protein
MNLTGYGGCIKETEPIRLPVLSVLLVDDEPFLLKVGKLYLERRPDISVSIASSAEDALAILDSTSFDVIISDYQMPGTDGIGFFKILREKQCPTPFILFTCRDREEIMTESFNRGAIFYLKKGGNPRLQFNKLDGKIREACRQQAEEGAWHKTGPSLEKESEITINGQC